METQAMKQIKGLAGFVLPLLLVVAAVAQEETAVPPFKDVTELAGIVLPDRIGRANKVTGQTWGDYDQDGWLDLYLTDTAGANVLYHNNGDGTFNISPLTASISLPDALSGGAVFADYDNDGWPDLYVLNWGANVLFHNDGGDNFTDVTELAGVGDEANGQTASFGDYDQDGYLDLYVANWSCYPNCGRPSEGDRDRLYHNNGDGTFTDVTNLLGGKTRGSGFVASFVDYDNDGDLDIYLVNDEFINPIGNVLWRNDGPGCGDGWCFTIVSKEAGADEKVMGMGLATADYDSDGDLDFYFSNAGPMTLLQNQGDGTFANAAELAGVNYPKGIGWGSVFFDFDNDGWRDLYLAVMKMADSTSAGNPLFRNNGDGAFVNLGQSSGAADEGATIGVAYADYDQDGWVDLVIGNFDQGYRLYRNQGGVNNWLTLKLVGGGKVNRDGIGARVTVVDSDGRSQMQEVKCGSSLGAGNALELYFGLGQAEATAVTIQWPDGTTQQLGPMAANQRHELRYGVNPITPIDISAAAADATPAPVTGGSQEARPTVWPWAAAALALAAALYLYRQVRRQS